VQKENAILLSEINYQLYLMNQNLERLLLTNSVMAIQNTNAISSNLTFNKESTADEAQTSPDATQQDNE
jgi:intracellular multiplication protein IcmX